MDTDEISLRFYFFRILPVYIIIFLFSFSRVTRVDRKLNFVKNLRKKCDKIVRSSSKPRSKTLYWAKGALTCSDEQLRLENVLHDLKNKK